MSEVFTTSGESSDITAGPAPRLQGLFIPGIDNSQFVDGFGVVTPWGGGGTARRYADYGISDDISRQNTQLSDLASSLIPAEGGGISLGLEGPQGLQGIPGRDGIDGIIHVMGLNLPQNSNFLAALPHNLDLINDLGTAADKLIYTDAYNTYTDIVWSERQPAGASDEYWYGAASDSDGSNLIVADYTGRLWTSNDSGATWTERRPAGDADKNWRAVASDSDGSNLIAAASSGRLYTSADSGVNWTERQPAGDYDKDWQAVASDADGSNLVAAILDGRLYTSADSGVNWTERQPGGNFDLQWRAVASDSDGSNLIAAASSGRLYTSANSGVNWSERQPAGAADKGWRTVASDADGSHLVAGISSGRLYTSANSGVAWTERQPAGDVNESWRAAGSDSDGSHLIVGAYTGRLYISTDSGVTWTEEQPAGDIDTSWHVVASDLDGSNFIAGARPERLYTGVDTTLYSEATWAESALTSAGRAILDDADAPAQATTLGLGTGDSPTWVGATLSAGPFDLSGKQTVGTFASPIDVTATRQYGVELHYSGDDYDVTGLRSRARLKTTDTTATACGGLLQAANEDGIDAGVLNGALIEAIGKSDANAATIAVMRGALVNTEWGDYDTVTNLKTLHVRTHSRNAAGAGSFGTGYGIYIENEAVGGNGQAYDAGIYFKGTNLSGGNKAFTYGIDFSGGTYGTAEIKLKDGGTIGSSGASVIINSSGLHINSPADDDVTLLTLESDISNNTEYNQILFKVSGGKEYGAIRSYVGNTAGDSYMVFLTSTTSGGVLDRQVTIQHNGYTGFGTWWPGERIHVVGNAFITGGIELGHASDTTLTRVSAGDINIEGNLVYRAGGTDVPIGDGGTGASSAGAARTNLGLVIGTNVQAYDAGLLSLAGLTYAAAAFVKMTGANTFALRTIAETADDLEGTIDHNSLANYAANQHYTQANIVATGTIASGTWEGTSIAVGYTDAKCTDATADNTATQIAGGITLDDGAVIRCAGAPVLTFNDTSNYLGITGCNTGFGISTPAEKVHIYESSVSANLLIESDGDAASLIINANTGENAHVLLKEAGTSKWQIRNKASDSSFRIYKYDATAGDMFFIDSTGNIGAGVVPVTKFTVEGTITLKEQAAADGDTAAYGQLWCKTVAPNQLWFTDDTGTDFPISGWSPASWAGEESVTYPNGMIWKHGVEVIAAATTDDVTYAVAFPTAFVTVQATFKIAAAMGEAVSVLPKANNETTILQISNRTGAEQTVYWQVWGY